MNHVGLLLFGLLFLAAPVAAAKTTVMLGSTYTLVTSTYYTTTTYWTYPGTDHTVTYISSGSITTRIERGYYNEGEAYFGNYTSMIEITGATVTSLVHVVVIASTLPEKYSDVAEHPITKSFSSTSTITTETIGTTSGTFSERAPIAFVNVWTYTSGTNTVYSTLYIYSGYRLTFTCPVVKVDKTIVTYWYVTTYGFLINSTYRTSVEKSITYEYMITQKITMRDVPYTSLDTKTYFAGSMIYHSTSTDSMTIATVVAGANTYSITIGYYSGLKELTTNVFNTVVTTITVTFENSISPTTLGADVQMYFSGPFVYGTYYSTSAVWATFEEEYVLTYVPESTGAVYGCVLFFYENVFVNFNEDYFAVTEHFFIGSVEDEEVMTFTLYF